MKLIMPQNSDDTDGDTCPSIDDSIVLPDELVDTTVPTDEELEELEKPDYDEVVVTPTTGSASNAATAITDSPIDRMTIAQLRLDQLDAELERIRTVRLAYVQKVKSVTRVDASLHWQQMYIKFQADADKVTKKLKKFDAEHDKMQIEINKLRAMLLEMGELVNGGQIIAG
ncbi:unnamed protein product [Sphagnum balticum]